MLRCSSCRTYLCSRCTYRTCGQQAGPPWRSGNSRSAGGWVDRVFYVLRPRLLFDSRCLTTYTETVTDARLISREGSNIVVQQEVAEKKRRVRTVLGEHSLDAIYLKTQSNFCWLTGGGLNVVGITMETGVAGLLLTPEREYLICSNIEVPRMRDEERLEEQGYQIHAFPWYDDQEASLVRELAGGNAIGADYPLAGTVNVSATVNPLRYSLTEWEVERYREVGRLTAAAIEDAAATIRPGDRECMIVGRLAERLWAERLDYITTFCAADERIADYRHPIATDRKIEKRAMLCVNARKWGLIISLTRFVQFEPVSAELRRRYDANVRIDCGMMANTVPGKPAVEAFRRGLQLYAETGFPDEYRLHHQGGSIGYVGRDYKVNQNTTEVVQENQGFAWNPSITGSKSEDTILATTGGPLMLSPPVTFPTMKIEVDGCAFVRPDILIM
ncbi:MAG: M24 family metallopeptidase [Spirochaetaceae bacterium]|nr:MAG: M24 family metallopeptidase [Spirochaetaceae bacterium]